MGAINHGTQTISYAYYEEITQFNRDKRNVSVIPRGIYSGGYLTKVSDSEVSISPTVVEIGDNDIQVKIKTAVSASLTAVTLDSGAIASATPYLVLRYAYLASVINYMEVHALASLTSAQANDIVIGKCVFSGSTLTGFSYTDRTFLNVQNLFFKVETTGATEMYVQLRAGRIQTNNGYILVPEQKVGPFTVPSAPNSRIDLVYIDTDGTAKISAGTAAASPVAPVYNGKMVVAQVTIANGDTSIPQSRITDVRSFITAPVSSLLGAWALSLTDTVYLAATDGFVCAYNSSFASGNLELYTDSSNPPVTKRIQDRGGQTGSSFSAGGMMPVKKGDYWKVVNASNVWWIPFGS